MSELTGQKKAVRERVLAARLALGEAERGQKSEAICAAIESMPEYRRASTILFYMPFRGEADVLPLLKKALSEGRKCALPKCADNFGLRFFWVTDASRDVEPGRWGILEPAEGRACECTGELFSVIMVPGVAFDRAGRRIGYGAGYYDRMLADCGNSLKIAPAYAFQVLPELPCGPLDRRVDVVATEDGIIDCRPAGGI